jgi:hypothetical protein
MTDFCDYCEGDSPVWHAAKEDILQMWSNLQPSPVQMAPIPENQKGTRLRNDGIRITGSPQFINSVLSRLKDVLNYDKQPGMRLDIEYRQIEPSGSNEPPAYLCYIHVEQDLKKKMTAPKVKTPKMDNPFEPPHKAHAIKTATPEV